MLWSWKIWALVCSVTTIFLLRECSCFYYLRTCFWKFRVALYKHSFKCSELDYLRSQLLKLWLNSNQNKNQINNQNIDQNNSQNNHQLSLKHLLLFTQWWLWSEIIQTVIKSKKSSWLNEAQNNSFKNPESK